LDAHGQQLLPDPELEPWRGELPMKEYPFPALGWHIAESVTVVSRLCNNDALPSFGADVNVSRLSATRDFTGVLGREVSPGRFRSVSAALPSHLQQVPVVGLSAILLDDEAIGQPRQHGPAPAVRLR